MRKRTSFAAMIAMAIIGVCLSFSASLAQGLFNYTPYPFISINQETYYTDGNYLVPDALPGGQRYFLVPVFIYNVADPQKNPNTKDGTWKSDDQRIPGVDGQFLAPIRSFQFQVHYPNQAIMVDTDPNNGSPIVTLGPDKSSAISTAEASSFRISWTDQSAHDSTNPYHRILRVTGASEIPLPLNPSNASDSDFVLCYIRFRIIPNWTVNTSILQLDSAVFADHLGDPQYNPNDYRRGNLAGHHSYTRGYLPVYITGQPAFGLLPLSIFQTTDNKNYSLLTTLVYDPTNPNAQNPSVNFQLEDAVALTRLTNVNINTDEPWLLVGTTNPPSQRSVFIQAINYTGSIGSDQVNLYIGADPSQVPGPGVYTGYVTLTSDGASNSPTRIKVTFIVQGRPDEPTSANGTGIRLFLTNSCTPTCTRELVFGTAPGASDGVDALFGESIFSVGDRAAAQNNSDTTMRCYAYFEPLNPNVDPKYQDPSFLGTLRDIRSDAIDSTILYKVDFGTGGPLCYPMTVCLDPNDLPTGARVIIRDVLNGSLFSYDMRQATQATNGQRCIVLRDPSITSFIIEYTRGSASATMPIQPKAWSLISLPVIPPDPVGTDIFPNASGTLLSYNASNGGWAPAPNLSMGNGYMVHYGSIIGTDRVVTGSRADQISNVRVHAGWNAVGAVSDPTCINTSTSQPTVFTTGVGSGAPPSFQSDFFEFVWGHGYQTVGYLIPGHGYFVKISDEGYYNVNAVAVDCKNSVDATTQLESELAKVTVRDADQNSQDLYFGNVNTTINPSRYEMPPAMISFDARFASNNGSISPNADAHTVKITSTNYPVTMNFENVAGTVEVRDLSGAVIGTVTGNGTVVIRDASIKTVTIAQKGSSDVTANGFSLEAAYPNPATGIATVGFSVPSETFVTITLTNALGQEIATLANGTYVSGHYDVKIDGNHLTAGTYFYTIHAGDFVQTDKVTITH